MSPYLTVEDVAVRLRISKRSVHERTRRGMIPHRRLAGTRRCLFVEDELEAWLNGAPLETIESPNGGRVVRPVAEASTVQGRTTTSPSLTGGLACDSAQ